MTAKTQNSTAGTGPARPLMLALLLAAISGCASSAGQSSTSVNHNSRVSIIVIHHTTANFGDSLQILTEPSSNPVSSHYLIPEPGDESYPGTRLKTYALVAESRRAWHAGQSYWRGKTGLNDQSIGIELVNQTYCHNSDTELTAETPQRICFYPDFDDTQIAGLTDLLTKIRDGHPDIRDTHIIGHSDIAPSRKIDPGPRFPWQRLARLGHGAWFDDDTVIRYWEQFRQKPLPLENIQAALSSYGYKIEVTGTADQQTSDVLRAFQLHFRPNEVTGRVNTDTSAILFALIEKYYPDELDALLQTAATTPDLN